MSEYKDFLVTVSVSDDFEFIVRAKSERNVKEYIEWQEKKFKKFMIESIKDSGIGYISDVCCEEINEPVDECEVSIDLSEEEDE